MSVAPIRQQVTTGARSRGRPSTGTLAAEPMREYVSGGTHRWDTQLRSLPWAFDDLTQDFGDDVYERMLLDPKVAASIDILKAGVLDDGVQISSVIDDKDDPEFDQAEMIADCIRRCLTEHMTTPLHDFLWGMLDALPLGNKVAEQVYMLMEDGPDAGRLCLDRLTVKPRNRLAFVVDAYDNTVGFLATIPGVASAQMVMTGQVIDPKTTPNLLPRAKFAVYTFRPRDHDPRGTSLIRPAYNPWWIKQQIWPEYLKYLSQFASASLVGVLAENAVMEPAQDAEGNVTDATVLDPAQALLDALITFRNGSALAVPYGTLIQAIHAQGDGRAFIAALDVCNAEIVEAIQHQMLATQSTAHQSRAAAETHQDVLTTAVRSIKPGLAAMLRQDIARPLVRYNFGAGALHLTPRITLGEIEQQDMTAEMGAIATLVGAGYFSPEQFPDLDRRFGFPVRTTAPPAAMPQNSMAGGAQPQDGMPPGQPTKSAPAKKGPMP